MIAIRVPGDKSISHRAALIAPLAASDSVIRGLSAGADVRSSIDVMQRLGADLACVEDASGLMIRCTGGIPLSEPEGPLDCGNSGTTARLLTGILAGAGIGALVDGDASLRGRPMRRVVYPLQAMGARIDYEAEPERLPIRVLPRATGGLRTLRHRARVASAQVKSAVLLAGVLARVRVALTEPALSRDHTERMLSAMGAPIRFDPRRRGEGGVGFDPEGWDGRLGGLDMTVPGDPSSAAFLIGAALLGGRAVRIEDVSANPGRTGFLAVLERMGAAVERAPAPDQAEEPRETWTVRPAGELRPFTVEGAEIPGLIDEIPLLAVLAARADGRSEIRGAGELRVKESDRLAGLHRALERLGVRVDERPDGLSITGRTGKLAGAVETHGDHRLAMAFGVLDAAGDADVEIDDPGCTAVSFPAFWDALEPFRTAAAAGVGAEVPHDSPRDDVGGSDPEARRVIALDGPAASGKSTTAGTVADRLGFVHVNSGLLYRAITWWALEGGLDDQPDALADAVRTLAIAFVPCEGGLTVEVEGTRPGPALHSAEVAARVSSVSTIPAVRDVVLARLRAAGRRYDLVCDGRDIGTTVFPEARLKVFLVASPLERASRRLRETEPAPTPEAIAAEAVRLEERDRVDSSRALSPLRRAEDAVELDTSDMAPSEVVEAIVGLAVERGLARP